MRLKIINKISEPSEVPVKAKIKGCVEIPHRTPPGSTGPHRIPPDPRRFIVPKKVEQINDHLLIDTYLQLCIDPPWGLSPLLPDISMVPI